MDFSEQNKVALYLTNSIDYETKKVNQAVKRNIDRFPERFCFQLIEEELGNRWSQIVTTSKLEDNKYRSKKYLPYIFTKQGIAMLAGILKIKIAMLRFKIFYKDFYKIA